MTYFSYGHVLKMTYNSLYQNSVRYNPSFSLISAIQKPNTFLRHNKKYLQENFWQHHTKKILTGNVIFIENQILKRSIPYSHALRLKRICIMKEDFTEQSKRLTKWLIEWKGWSTKSEKTRHHQIKFH